MVAITALGLAYRGPRNLQAFSKAPPPGSSARGRIASCCFVIPRTVAAAPETFRVPLPRHWM